MKEKEDKSNMPDKKSDNEKKTDLPGYPLYPDGEDIYSKYKEEESIDPEDISKKKETTVNKKAGKNNEKDFSDDKSGNDLDIPEQESDDSKKNDEIEDE